MSDSTGFEQHGFNALSGTLRVPSHHAAPHMSFRQTERPAPILPPRHLEFYDRSLTDADAQRLPMTASSESHRGLVLHESDLMQDTQRYSYGGYAPAPSPYMLPVERPDCFLLSSANPSSYTMEPMRSAPQYNATETSFRPPDYWTTSQSSDAVSQQGQGQSHVINAQTHNQRLTRGSSSSALESFEASLKTFTSLVQYGISPQEIEASLKRVFVETLERSPPIGQRQARSHSDLRISPEECCPLSSVGLNQKEKLVRADELDTLAPVSAADMKSYEKSASSASKISSAPASTDSPALLGKMGADNSCKEPKRHLCRKDPKYCQQTFSSLAHLKRHENIHSGVRPFECLIPWCKKTFTRRDNMLHHSKNHAKSAGLSLSQELVDATRAGPRRFPKGSNQELMVQLREQLRILESNATEENGLASNTGSHLL